MPLPRRNDVAATLQWDIGWPVCAKPVTFSAKVGNWRWPKGDLLAVPLRPVPTACHELQTQHPRTRGEVHWSMGSQTIGAPPQNPQRTLRWRNPCYPRALNMLLAIAPKCMGWAMTFNGPLDLVTQHAQLSAKRIRQWSDPTYRPSASIKLLGVEPRATGHDFRYRYPSMPTASEVEQSVMSGTLFCPLCSDKRLTAKSRSRWENRQGGPYSPSPSIPMGLVTVDMGAPALCGP